MGDLREVERRKKERHNARRWGQTDDTREGEPLLQIGGTQVRRDADGRLIQVSGQSGGKIAHKTTP